MGNTSDTGGNQYATVTLRDAGRRACTVPVEPGLTFLDADHSPLTGLKATTAPVSTLVLHPGQAGQEALVIAYSVVIDDLKDPCPPARTVQPRYAEVSLLRTDVIVSAVVNASADTGRPATSIRICDGTYTELPLAPDTDP